jgi:hypothetical protein
MRTVSFSQPQVQTILARDFVCFTTSTEGDPTAGQSIRHRPRDPAGPCLRGNGQQNVQTLFLTPAGEIFHAATGYLSPEDLLTELEFARSLFATIQEVPAADRAAEVQRQHRQRLEQLNYSPAEIDARSPNLGGLNFSGMDLSGMNLAELNLPALIQGRGNGRDFGTSGRRGGRDGRTAQGAAPVDALPNPFARGQILGDHQFCLDHPLHPAAKFDRDPTPLVGSGRSFFMSSGSDQP